MSSVGKFLFTASFLIFVVTGAAFAQDKMTAEEVVKRNLDSIGNAATRAGAKSRVFEATTHFSILAGGAASIDGKTVIVSEGQKIQLMMKFPNDIYSGEKFVSDGKRVQVAASTTSQNRSSFGQFVYIQDVVMREGLLGGELSTAWPLFDLEHRNPKLSFDGLKTVAGKQLLDVRYKPQRDKNIDIHLFFDSATFHHVMTIYTMSVDAQLVQGGAPNNLAVPGLGGKQTGSQGTVSNDAAQAGGQQQTRYRIEEVFDDFQSSDGFTLPNKYTIHFTQEPQRGKTILWAWDATGTRILENVPLDPRNFEVK